MTLASRGPNHHNADNYVNVTVMARKDKTLKGRAFIDSGNTVYQGSVINEAFHKRCGFKVDHTVSKARIKSANGKLMDSSGRSMPVTFKIANSPKSYTIRPEIIKGLADDFNLGAVFLQKNYSSIKLTPEGNSICLGRSCHQLVRTMVENDAPRLDCKQCHKKGEKPKMEIDEKSKVLKKETHRMNKAQAPVLKKLKLKEKMPEEPTKGSSVPEKGVEFKKVSKVMQDKHQVYQGSATGKVKSKVETRNTFGKGEYFSNPDKVGTTREESFILCAKNRVLKPRSLGFIKVCRIQSDGKEHVIEPLEDSNVENGFYTVPSVYSSKRDIRHVAVVNQSTKRVKVQKGQKIGMCSLGQVLEDTNEGVYNISSASKEDTLKRDPLFHGTSGTSGCYFTDIIYF